MKRTILFFPLFVISLLTFAKSDRFRVMFGQDPSSSIVIGWDQTSGSNPAVFYGDSDKGNNYEKYPFQKKPNRVVMHKGMNNHFVSIKDLTPNTIYYFVIKDNEGSSQRYSFKTCPNSPDERLSFIAGGDSRNNEIPRQNANKLVSKLRPHAVFFGGDMTNGDSKSEWIQWMNDWQLSIGSDGRITPIVVARGNHERSNESIFNLFNTTSEKIYYAMNFGGDLVRCYTLNSEISIAGDQTEWLKQDLKSNQTTTTWKMAQYHKPMRPHVKYKSEGNGQYQHWAPLFYEYNLKFVVECDAHTVKTTWPIVPSAKVGNDEGFVRDDANGTVYVGEGCWGAPLRTNNDSKSWTRDSGKFNQFKWIFIDKEKIEVRTIDVNNADEVGTVSESNIFEAPENLKIWSPSNGAVVTIKQ